MVATTQLRLALETEEGRRKKSKNGLDIIWIEIEFLPARASEQGNVIGLVSVYIYQRVR